MMMMVISTGKAKRSRFLPPPLLNGRGSIHRPLLLPLLLIPLGWFLGSNLASPSLLNLRKEDELGSIGSPLDHCPVLHPLGHPVESDIS